MHVQRAQRRNRVGSSFLSSGGAWAVLAGLLLLGLACSPDLREVVGPRLPVPNVEGRIVREGMPAPDVKVKLEVASTESLLVETRTDAGGRFALTEVAPGRWALKVGSTSPNDFFRVRWEFGLETADTVVVAPVFDLSLRGLRLDDPEADAVVPRPSLFSPLRFRWSPGEGEARVGGNRATETVAQIRVYGPDGEAVWYSLKSSQEEVVWNGLANRGEGVGRPVDAGSYTWRLRVDGDEDVEYTTAARTFVLVGSAP